ncbi:MAG TPA: BrnT family toxin [Terriglobia bacterium]|nr:BrnT family toxin [Terriglobia bacterium]
MVFAWDPKKSGVNRRKHGVSFERAVRVFEDPNAVSYVERVVEGEERWHTIGLAGSVVLLLVVHTVEEEDGEETIRVISARKADSREQALYEAPR